MEGRLKCPCKDAAGYSFRETSWKAEEGQRVKETFGKEATYTDTVKRNRMASANKPMGDNGFLKDQRVSNE